MLALRRSRPDFLLVEQHLDRDAHSTSYLYPQVVEIPHGSNFSFNLSSSSRVGCIFRMLCLSKTPTGIRKKRGIGGVQLDKIGGLRDVVEYHEQEFETQVLEFRHLRSIWPCEMA